MLGGQYAVFLSCSEKFRQALGWPVRDVLAGHGVRGIIVSDEPLLPGTGRDAAAKVESYLDASSAFVALCTADHLISDGTSFPRASIIEEIDRAVVRPHLRDRCQILTSPGVLLPSNVGPAGGCLEVDKPACVAEAIVQRLREWGVVPRPPGPAGPLGSLAHSGVSGAGPAGDLGGLFAGLRPGDHEEARRRVYRLLGDRGESRRRSIARALHGAVLDAGDHARQLTAASLVAALSEVDASLVPVKMIEMLAAGAEYPARACAANLLRERAITAPPDVPVALLGRLAWPSREDWYVWAPAMAAVKELVLSRPAAYVIFESLSRSTQPQDRHAVAQALLDVAAVKPAAVAADLAGHLLDDPDPLVMQKAQEVVTAIEHITDRERAACYAHFGI